MVKPQPSSSKAPRHLRHRGATQVVPVVAQGRSRSAARPLPSQPVRSPPSDIAFGIRRPDWLHLAGLSLHTKNRSLWPAGTATREWWLIGRPGRRDTLAKKLVVIALISFLAFGLVEGAYHLVQSR
jgi:hypothetical protein